jgi:uncharacterized membrane protein (UPF0182 family)
MLFSLYLLFKIIKHTMDLYTFLQKFHSGWAYLALLLLVIAVVTAIVGFTSKKEFTAKDRKIALFGLIGSHVQLLVGLILYFVSPLGLAGFSMKVAEARLTSLEHPLINVIALVLITIGWSKHKKAATSELKFKSFAVFYTIGLLLILARIPWHLWF